ncbi:MAG: lactonase family protein [Acidimicrobiia bacterium]|nr:lactonase family protein [Acidimicrobiia bacterium]
MRSLRNLAASALALAFLASSLPAKDYLVYVGTYTRGKSQGIYAFRMDSAGKLTPLGLAAETANPSFLAIHPNQRFLYSVSEQKSGAINAYSIDKSTGKLTLLNTVGSGGTGPCHLNVDKTGKNLLAANYGSGSAAVLPINNDGSLKEHSSVMQHAGSSVDPKRQQGPHAHSVNLSADNRFAVVADLGLDQILVYKFDPAKGTLAPNDPPYAKVKPGAGPRHFSFHPGGRFAYVINEMQSTVTAFSYNAKAGSFAELQTITSLPADFTANNSTAEVLVHPSGKFLYGSNRGHNSIAVFAIDSAKGTLTPVQHASTQGEIPRNFNMDPSGSFLIAGNQNTDNMVVFKIDAATGRLTPTGQNIEIGAPVCIKYLPLN